jgi:mannose-6-phosphate isomerase-like protein (cupin superfamily)
MTSLSRKLEDFRWEEVPLLAYKQEGNTFRDITRQTLFEGEPALPCQWRYFEIASGGHSSLERHEHLHVVMIIRGRGQAMVADRVLDLNTFDMLRIGALTWHQFRATRGEPLGFLCLVNIQRDRPQLPDPAALARLRSNPLIADFLRV